MDVTSKNHHATKTDLSLLLECLKYQMKYPDSQKRSLLTINSICQQREENVDLFMGMGGVVFVYNLSKSSVHSEVKETAFFTLGMLAEANVYCKQSLCRKEMFSDLADCLMQDCPLTLRRVTVYLLSVLVSNNRAGQSFAQSTGCLDILLDLFRTSFPLSSEAMANPVTVSQVHQLWTSVSSALCGCVNNPQNEEVQHICVSAFPLVRDWLQQMALPRTEMVQPICSFITMTVANNTFAQQSFSSVGGLETLIHTLIRVASNSAQSTLACQLSVIMTKTLSACISDNSALASGLAQHNLVEHLLPLLISPSLVAQDQLSVILTLGHCTEACEEHQSQLLQCGGLSVIITLLTESHSEEVKKAATFILQTCKQATMSLRGPARGRSQDQGQAWQAKTPVDIEAYWRSAREMLHRINQLESRQAQEGPEEDGEPPNQLGPAGGARRELPPPSPLFLPPPLKPHPASMPHWDGRGGGYPGRGEEIDQKWGRRGGSGEACGGGGGGDGDDKRGTEKRSGAEEWRPDVERRERSGGGEKRCEEWGRELTPAGHIVEKRVREDERAGWENQRDRHQDAQQLPVGRVRRQIFQASEEPQKPVHASIVSLVLPVCSNVDRERPRTHSHTHREENVNADGQSHTERHAHTNTHSLREEREEREEEEKGGGGGSEVKRRNCEQVKPTALYAHTHAQPERRLRVAEKSHATSGPPARTGVGVPWQPPVGEEVRCTAPRTTVASAPPLPLEGDIETDSQLFKLPDPKMPPPPLPPRRKDWIDDEDLLSMCSDLLDDEVSKILETPESAVKSPGCRCSGCVVRFSEVTSRTFPALLRSCPDMCDLHTALQAAADRRRGRLPGHLRKRDALGHARTPEHGGERTAAPRRRDANGDHDHWRIRGVVPEISLTPIRRGGLMRSMSTQGGQHRTGHVSHRTGEHLGPQHVTMAPSDISLTPIKKPCPNQDRRPHCGEDRQCGSVDQQNTRERHTTRRERRNFSNKEVRYLLQGVKRFGPSWNSILWAYPFQPGRTNVDLAKKHRRLQVQAQDVTYP